MRDWFRSHKSTVKGPTTPQTARPRPALEPLEDRCLLASGFFQNNLVSDIPGIAKNTDPNLVNPWGLAYGAGGPFWVSDNNSGLSTLYDGKGAVQGLVVQIPSPGSPTGGAPTGIVFNPGNGFQVTENGSSGPSAFIFANEDGVISGWSPGVDLFHAITAVDNSSVGLGAVYKGLAIGKDSLGNSLIYAANFRQGTIDVYDKNFHQFFPGSFQDPNIPKGYAPFDIQNLGGQLYVTYAKQNAEKHDDVAGPGHGFIDVFNTNGVLQKRLVSHTDLNSPWGLALAPSDFGQFSNDLLVGNFGSGRIDAFDPNSGAFLGQLTDILGHPITIGGLWALKFGDGGQSGPKDTLFFSAGIGDESHGLFGSLQAVSGSGPNAVASPDLVLTSLVMPGPGSGRTVTPSNPAPNTGTSTTASNLNEGGVDQVVNGQATNLNTATVGQATHSGAHSSADKAGTEALDRLFQAL